MNRAKKIRLGSDFFESSYYQDSSPEEYEELFSKRASLIKPGLARMNAAWEKLGFPSRNIPCIHVAGTNGKGSTSAFAWMLLRQLGFSAGLYTSPHLHRFEERFLTDHGCVKRKELVEALAWIHTRVSSSLWEELTFFEIATLAAFVLFEEQKCQGAIFEVGLGGRLDATNVVNPVVALITSIGVDHAEWLGDTTQKIAAEKAGIIKRGKPVIWGGVEQSDRDSDAVVKAVSRESTSKLYSFGEDIGVLNQSTFFIETSSGKKVTLEFPKSLKPLNGFLRRNFCLATQSVWVWSESIDLAKSEASRLATIQNAIHGISLHAFDRPPSLIGRFMLCTVSKGSRSVPVCFDVCHNPHGAKALCEQLKISFGENAKFPFVISILQDKDAFGIWHELSDISSTVNLFKTQSQRSWDLGQDKVPGAMHGNFLEAFEKSVNQQHVFDEINGMIPNPFVICGSVYGVGQAIKELASSEWKIHDS